MHQKLFVVGFAVLVNASAPSKPAGLVVCGTQNIALGFSHQEMDGEHPALALILQNESLIPDLLDPLATKLLAGEFKPGDRIKVGAKDD